MVRDGFDELTCSEELVTRRAGLNSLPPPVLNLWGFTVQSRIIAEIILSINSLILMFSFSHSVSEKSVWGGAEAGLCTSL